MDKFYALEQRAQARWVSGGNENRSLGCGATSGGQSERTAAFIRAATYVLVQYTAKC